MKERVRGWLARYGVDVALCAFIVVLTVFVRWATLDQVESGGDPLDNWFFVKQWGHTDGLFSGYLNHHNSRFGIHWITWVVQRLFGTETVDYFIAPVFASTVCSVLIYVLGRQVSSRAVGLIAALMLLEFDGFEPASSQLRPGVFEAMYVLGALCFLVHALEQDGRARDRAVLASGFFAFMAWLAKEPTAFFLPGMGLVYLFGGRRWRDATIFTLTFLFFVGLESLAYSVFTKYPHRVAVVMNAHGAGIPEPHDFWFLFTRFTKAGDGWRLVYYFFFAAGLSLLASTRPLKQKALVWVTISFLFLCTFAIKSTNPIRLWMPMNDRYLTASIPPALVANAIVIVEAALAGRRALLGGLRSWSKERWQLGDAWHHALGTLALSVCVAALAVKTWIVSAPNRARHPIAEARRMSALLSDAYARGLPIVGQVTRPPKRKGQGAQVRSLHWAVKGFVDEKLQLTPDGQLPPFSYVASVGLVGPKARYVPLVPQLSEPIVLDMLKKQPECVLVLKDVNNGPTVIPSNTGSSMPEHCSSGGVAPQ